MDFVYLIESGDPWTKTNKMTGPFLTTMVPNGNPSNEADGVTELFGKCSEHQVSLSHDPLVSISCAVPLGQDAACFTENGEKVHQIRPGDLEKLGTAEHASSISATHSSAASEIVAQSAPAKPLPHAHQASQSTGAVATVLIDTDDTCRLSMDGEDQGPVTPSDTKKIRATPGDHILKCVVEGIPDLTWRKIVTLKAGENTAALVSLKAVHIQYDQAIDEQDKQKQEAAAAEEKRKAEIQAREELRHTEEQRREQEQAELPQKMFDVLRGNWDGVRTLSEGMNGFPPILEPYHFEFVQVEGRTIKTIFSIGDPHDVRSEGEIIPTDSNHLSFTSVHCFTRPTKKEKTIAINGWVDRGSCIESYVQSRLSIVNGNRLDFSWGAGQNIALTR